MAEIAGHRGLFRSEHGAQLVEFALVLPLLLLVVLGIAEFGFMFQRYEVLTNAAREGARIAILPGYTTADAQARVEAYLDAGGVPADGRVPAVVATVPVVLPGGTTVSTKRVTLTYFHTYMFIPGIGGWFGSSYTSQQLSAVAAMRVE